jgi:hypothetical protein
MKRKFHVTLNMSIKRWIHLAVSNRCLFCGIIVLYIMLRWTLVRPKVNFLAGFDFFTKLKKLTVESPLI